MTEAVVFIGWSGLKHYKSVYIEFGSNPIYTVYLPSEDRIYRNEILYTDTIYLVDSSVATGKTLYRVAETLRKHGYRGNIYYVGDPKTDEARNILDYELTTPEITGYTISVSGYSGTGKSAYAYGLKTYLDNHGYKTHYIQWGKWIKQNFDIGKYGETLMIIEKQDPFLVPLRYIQSNINQLINREIIVIDGVKTIYQANTIAYATNKPLIPIYTEIDEKLRRITIYTRKGEDDVYDVERKHLFRDCFKQLMRYSFHIRLDKKKLSNRDKHIYRLFNVEPPTIRDIYNPYHTKKTLLENFNKIVVKTDGVDTEKYIEEVGEGYRLHNGYIRRLRKKGIILDRELEKHITYIATGYRVIDDILDENLVRYISEEDIVIDSYWALHGIHKAVLYASLLLTHAKYIARQHGYLKEFMNMHRRVIDAVKHELELETSNRQPTMEDWYITLDREYSFRKYIYNMAGLPEREAYIDSIVAQVKDDIYGLEKGGRTATEDKLNRPLIQKILDSEVVEEIKQRLETDKETVVYMLEKYIDKKRMEYI